MGMGVDEKYAIFRHSAAENARVCFANSIRRFVKVKLKWCEIKGKNRSFSCRWKWVCIN